MIIIIIIIIIEIIKEEDCASYFGSTFPEVRVAAT